MPSAGHPMFDAAYDFGAGMSDTFANPDFFVGAIDGDELFLDSPFGSGNGCPDSLTNLDYGKTKTPMAALDGQIQTQSVAGLSPPSHRGSSSSGSSRSVESVSPKTSQASADTVMTDQPCGDGDYKMRDGLPNSFDLNNSSRSADALVPASHFDDIFDFESASSSPSALMNGTGTGTAGNHATGGVPPGHVPKVRRTKGRSKTQSQPQAVSLNGFAYGSREASPMDTSQGSSPAATFNNSPSPGFPSAPLGGFNPDPFACPPLFPGQRLHGNHNTDPANGPTPNGPQQLLFNNQPYHSGGPRLSLQTTPTKSRVETQIPVKMMMNNLPPGIRRLHLPMHTMSKAKLLAKPAEERKRSPDMYELYTMLVCTSAMQDEGKRRKAFARAAKAGHPTSPELSPNEDKPQDGGEVHICTGCIAREKKRAGRKKNKKPEEEELWAKYQHHRAIVFNTNEIKEWQAVPVPTGMPELAPKGTVQVEAPMRIACYCRHHQEKSGFQVIFTIKDYRDEVIVQQISSSIMITDDHKTHVPTSTTLPVSNSPDNATTPALNGGMNDGMMPEMSLMSRHSQSTSDLQSLQQSTNPVFPSSSTSSQATSVTATPRSSSRQGSPTLAPGPVSKKRKASNSTKIPSGLAMTRLETAPQTNGFPPSVQPDSAVASAATSPFSPALGNFSGQLYQQPSGHQSTVQPFTAGSPASNGNSNDHMMFANVNRNMSVDSLHQMAQSLYSAPVSGNPSRAPSPTHLRTEAQAMHNVQLAQALYSGPVGVNAARSPPLIHKIIPGEGPKSGGIEVTILGSGFTNGGLEVMFGEQRATTTTFWGESSLVCLLPPSPVTGPVFVSIKQPSTQEPQPLINKHQSIFRYVDDNEEQLMRTALAVLGQKLGGNIKDIADLARSIIGPRPGQAGWGAGPSPGGGGSAPGTYGFELGPCSLETGLLRVLELVDLDDSVNKAKINLRRSTGQTMLHLACALGMHRFVAGLLSRGANVGARDKGGYTSLHFAAMNNHSQIVRRLMIHGADPNMRSLSGFTPADVAVSRDVVRALHLVETHSRSRSTGSLHSRVSSATSLRSLWDPPTMAAHNQEFMSEASESEEDDSSIYEDSSYADEEDDNDNEWLNMRRPSLPRNHQLPEIAPPANDVPAALASPGAAMTAVREQIATQLQQIQQSMAMLSQSWPQFQLPVMPDYHNYLHNAPVMQRIASMVPNIGGSRPGSADNNQQPREGDKQWWEIPAIFGGKEAPPPAYEDIFPQERIDTKQASAATAAAEYEADAKCTALYDQATPGATLKVREVPTLLQIGRKNAITKEQQENLQRAHAERLKTGSSDKMLWFVWIPLLTFILGAMMVSGGPAFAAKVASMTRTAAHFVSSSGPMVLQRGVNGGGAVEVV